MNDIVYNCNTTFHSSVKETPEREHIQNSSTGIIRSGFIDTGIQIGDKVRVLEIKSTFLKGYEIKYSKSIYNVSSGNNYSFALKNNNNTPPDKKHKYYELLKIQDTEQYFNELNTRELPLARKETKNFDEIDELSRMRGPPHKKRRINSPATKRDLDDKFGSPSKRCKRT